jgi:hypothetical protein
MLLSVVQVLVIGTSYGCQLQLLFTDIRRLIGLNDFI